MAGSDMQEECAKIDYIDNLSTNKSTVKSHDSISCESWRSGKRPLSSIEDVLKFLPSIMKSTGFILMMLSAQAPQKNLNRQSSLAW